MHFSLRHSAFSTIICSAGARRAGAPRPGTAGLLSVPLAVSFGGFPTNEHGVPEVRPHCSVYENCLRVWLSNIPLLGRTAACSSHPRLDVAGSSPRGAGVRVCTHAGWMWLGRTGSVRLRTHAGWMWLGRMGSARPTSREPPRGPRGGPAALDEGLAAARPNPSAGLLVFRAGTAQGPCHARGQQGSPGTP